MVSKKKKKSTEKRGFKARLNAMRDLLRGSVEDAHGEGDRVEYQPENSGAHKSSEGAEADDHEIGSLEPGEAQVGNGGNETDSEHDDNEVSEPGELDHEAKTEEVDLEQIVEDLHSANSVSDRVIAVRRLGKSRNQRATPHLVAAMFDDEPLVRLAAEEAMAQLDQVTVEAPASTPPEIPDDSSPANAEPESDGPHSVTESAPRPSRLNGMAHLHLESDAPGEAKPLAPSSPTSQIPSAADAPEEERKLIQEHEAATRLVDELHHQIFKLVAARTGQEKQASWRIKREAKLRNEVAERIRAEEEALRNAEKEAQLRRAQEIEAIEAERAARLEAEAEAHRLSQEESRLRLEAANQSRTATEIIQHHAALVVAREEAALEAQRAAAARAVAEAQEHQRAGIENLHQEEQVLRLAIEETARRRNEVEAARRREENDAAMLAEAQQRMRTAEEVRAKAEEARAQLEAELLTHVEAEERLLTEARQRGEQERQRLAKEFRRQQESLDQELAFMKSGAEQSRLEAERTNKTELERLRTEQDALQAATEEASRLRDEVEAAKVRAVTDAEDLAAQKAAADQARLEAAQRNQTEIERLHQEQETLQVASVEASRLRAEVEAARTLEEQEVQVLAEAQHRLQSEAKDQKESAERRRAEVEAALAAVEEHNNRLAQREKALGGEIDRLQSADAEARKRIAAAETRKRSAEQAYELVADQIQRLEAESHASVAEEQRIAARFETDKKNALTAAKARAEHEKQIRQEVETLRRRAEEDNNRLKSLVMQRAEAEEAAKKYGEAVLAEEEALRIAKAQASAAWIAQEREVEMEESTAPVSSFVETAAEVDAGVADRASVAEQTATSESVESIEPAAMAQEEEAEKIPDAVASYLRSVDPYKRAAAVAELARSKADDAFGLIVTCFDDQSSQVRNAAALALRSLEPTRVVDSFNRALEDSSAERRANIGSAIAGSGLASEAVNNLASDSREDTYNALSILFVMTKAGEIKPLVEAIEEHENDEVRRAVIKLLTLSGHSAAGDAALQRRVLGVPSNRQKAQKNDQDSVSEVRSRVAEAEVKRAVNGKKPADAKPEAGTN